MALAALLLFSSFLSAQAQVLIPLGGSCSSSVQCVGVSICFQTQCACPASYMNIGASCVFQNVAIAGPVPISSVPLPALQVAYPGSPCGTPRVSCSGGSYCFQGSCGCRPGYVVQGQSCVVAPGPAAVFPAPQVFPAPLPQPAPVQIAYPGGPCFGAQVTCTGGSVCNQGTCGCQPGYVVSAQSCIAAPLPVPQPIPTQIAYPGTPCNGPGVACVGGSFCSQGTCGCPPRYVVSQQSCVVPAPRVVAGPVPVAPYSFPGNPCSRSQICLGGSICNSGNCGCPAGLTISAQSCVPPPAPVPIAPAPVSIVYPGNPCGVTQTCVGGSICQSGTCGCQPGYVVSSGSCVVQPVPAPVAVGPAPSFNTYSFPGTLCGVSQPCAGGSICNQGTCGCPNGFIISGQSCIVQQPGAPVPVVPAPQIIPAPPQPFAGPIPIQGPIGGPVPFAPVIGPYNPPISCPAGQIYLGTSCVAQTVLGTYPPGSLCFNTPCSGSARCVNGLCNGGPVPVAGPIFPVQPPSFLGGPIAQGSIAPGGPCGFTQQCVVGANCVTGSCSCAQGFASYGSVCVKRSKRRPILYYLVRSRDQNPGWTYLTSARSLQFLRNH